jgi:hypothetical protein
MVRALDESTPTPFRVRVPGFLNADQEIGLGEVIKRGTSRAGIRPCGGCGRRATTLDRWVTFTGSARRVGR